MIDRLIDSITKEATDEVVASFESEFLSHDEGDFMLETETLSMQVYKIINDSLHEFKDKLMDELEERE